MNFYALSTFLADSCVPGCQRSEWGRVPPWPARRGASRGCEVAVPLPMPISPAHTHTQSVLTLARLASIVVAAYSVGPSRM